MKAYQRQIKEMSKEEEIEFLAGLVNDFSNTNSYLKFLFTPELLQWFKGEVINDTSCDIIDTINYWIKQNKTLQDNYTLLKNATDKELTNLYKEIKSLREDILQLINLKLKLEKHIEDQKNLLIEAKKENDDIIKSLYDGCPI